MFLQGLKIKKYHLYIICFLLGIISGVGYSIVMGSNAVPYDEKQLTENIRYAQVESGKLQCTVLVDNASLYSEPSALTGRIIDRMSKGLKVDYLETVSSQDKDERYAVVDRELKFRRLFSKMHIIPAETKVFILRFDDGNGETVGRVIVDGKEYKLDFDTEFLRLPYVGQWKKIEFNGRSGFMKFNDLSDSSLM